MNSLHMVLAARSVIEAQVWLNLVLMARSSDKPVVAVYEREEKNMHSAGVGRERENRRKIGGTGGRFRSSVSRV